MGVSSLIMDSTMTGQAPTTLTHPYQMTVDLNVLDHLGIKLYSNVAAVLAEAVANTWDADAANVSITFNKDDDLIEISDDGIGMTVEDMNEKYLRVGYARREEDPQYGDITAKGRPVMGCKGLGKLSLFSIARIIEIRSSHAGISHGCCLDSDAISKAAKSRISYYPEKLDTSSDDYPCLKTGKTGTTITLRHLKRSRLELSARALRKRLARRFSVIGNTHDFNMFINGEPISISERGDITACQFVWTIGDSGLTEDELSRLDRHKSLDDTIVDTNSDWLINGWIGTARDPKRLNDDEAGNMNGIVLLARGRLFHENIAESISDGRIYTKYITGQINADFLDVTDRADIATSDRQRVQEDDPRILALQKHMRRILNQVDRDWNNWRAEAEVKRITEQSPTLGKWLEGLSPGHRKHAKQMIRQISRAHFNTDEDRKELIRHSVYAFERMALRGSTAELADAVEDPQELLKLLADQDSLEAGLYLDIISSRLEAIAGLTRAVDENVKERVLQEYLFNHLWLLDPSWERAVGSERMESQLRYAGVITDDLSEKEKLSRVDLCYKTVAGKHIIVELKRPGRVLKLIDLQEQGYTYVDKLRKIEQMAGTEAPLVEVVFVLGKPVAEEASNPSRLGRALASISPGSRIVHYEELIRNAREAYSSYLEKHRQYQRAQRIADNL